MVSVIGFFNLIQCLPGNIFWCKITRIAVGLQTVYHRKQALIIYREFYLAGLQRRFYSIRDCQNDEQLAHIKY